MQNAVLVISMVGVFIFGFLLMRRVDGFLTGGGFHKTPGDSVVKDVLVFSECAKQSDEMNAIKDSLGGLAKQYDIINKPQIPEKCRYGIVVSISDNDMENLMLCAMAKRLYVDVFTVAKCNDKRYEPVFCRDDIDVFVFDDRSALSCICSRVK